MSLPTIEKKACAAKDVLKQIQPLDLFFWTSDCFVDDCIRLGQSVDLKTGCPKFTHVSMIVTSDLFENVPGMHPAELYTYEATWSDKLPDVEAKKPLFGVQIRNLRDVLSYYSTLKGASIYWGRLKNNPWVEAEKKRDRLAMTTLVSNMQKMHNKYAGTVYDTNMCDFFGLFCCPCRPERDLMKAVLADGRRVLVSTHLCSDKKHGGATGKGGWLDPANWVFCSELLTKIYQGIGYLDKDVDSLNVSPADFIPMTSKMTPVDVSALSKQ